MTTHNAEQVRQAVRQAYGAVATAAHNKTGEGAGCCEPGCCSPGASGTAIGYSDAERAALPEGADLGLGCGNPQAIASLQPGERVLDLGSGAGIDVFLAAQQVGESGRAIGVDMTAEMLAKARGNAERTGLANVEFRLGEIEHLPVADASVDVIMSNCVINLSPDKPAVFREAFRVLAPGGRLAISDIVSRTALPEELASDLAAHTACVAGAAVVDDLRAMMTAAGFVDVRIDVRAESRELVSGWVPGQRVEDYVGSAYIQGRKPGAR